MTKRSIEQVQALGLKLIPVKVPDWTLDASGFGVESAVFFDETDSLRTRQADDQASPRQRIPQQPFDSGGGVSAVAARAGDDDGEAGGSDGGSRCVSGSGESRAGARPRWQAGEGAAMGGTSPFQRSPMPTPLHHGEFGVLSGAIGPEWICAIPARPPRLRFTRARSEKRNCSPFGKAYQDASGFHLKHPTLTT